MTSTPGTLVELFSELHGGRWAESMKSLEGGPAYARIMTRLATHGRLMNNVEVFRTVAARIVDMLRLDLGVILVGGWKKMADLRSYTDRGKYGPDETVFVEITRHIVTSTHKPSLDIMVDGVKIDTVPFELKLTITIDGALLTIRDGKILAVSPGACKAGGELKFEGYTILKRDSKPVRVPGTWTFKEPIEIPPPHRARPVVASSRAVAHPHRHGPHAQQPVEASVRRVAEPAIARAQLPGDVSAKPLSVTPARIWRSIWAGSPVK